MKYVIMALLSGFIGVWSSGCGAIVNPAQANDQPAAEVVEESLDANDAGEMALFVANDEEAMVSGNYYENGTDSTSDGEDRPWLPLTLGGFIGTYQMCGSPSVYTPFEGYETFTVVAVGGKRPWATFEYLVEWHMPNGAIENGTLAELSSVRISLATLGELVAYISDDYGEHWEKINMLTIAPYIYYPSEGKGGGKG